MIIKGISKKAFINNMLKYNKKIVCFGASLVCKIFFIDTGLGKNIEYFVDTFKFGTEIIMEKQRYTVHHPSKLLETVPCNTVILVCATTSSRDICNYLKSINLHEHVDIYLLDDLMGNYYDRNVLLKSMFFHMDQVGLDSDEYIDFYKKITTPGFLLAPMVAHFLLQKCSLRCKHCGVSIPYIKKPADYTATKIMQDIEVFFNNIDYCASYQFNGGEPFLYKNLKMAIKKIFSFDSKFSNFCLVTNGTIIPDEETFDLLKNKKTSIHITSYGELNKITREKLIEIFEANSIKYLVINHDYWYDVHKNELKPLNRDINYSLYYLLNCKSRHSIFNGKLYSCGLSMTFDWFRLCDYSFEDEIVLLNKSEDLRKKIKDLYYKESSYLCNFCYKRVEDRIPVGEQIVGRIPEDRYLFMNSD